MNYNMVKTWKYENIPYDGKIGDFEYTGKMLGLVPLYNGIGHTLSDETLNAIIEDEGLVSFEKQEVNGSYTTIVQKIQ